MLAFSNVTIHVDPLSEDLVVSHIEGQLETFLAYLSSEDPVLMVVHHIEGHGM